MIVRPVLLDDEAKAALGPSMGPLTWQEVEGWIAEGCACVWRIGQSAWALTLANGDYEVEILAAGGSGAWRAAAPFEKAMRALPEHKGMTLRIDGRAGWRRLYRHWDCDESGVLTLKV